MERKSIRWQQRFENFERSFALLEKSIRKPELSELERGGLIQFFEVTFELGWKVLKDYLESEGLAVNSPREAIKQAFQANLLTDGHKWIEALENRNLTTHTYDEATSHKVEMLIRTAYFPLLQHLHETLRTKKTP